MVRNRRIPEVRNELKCSSDIAGPSGLQVALSLVRQGVSFRIIGQS